MLHDVALGTEHRPDPVGWVVVAQVHRDGPLQHGVDPLLDGLGDDRLGVPDGGEDREHGGAGHLRDRPPADARERVAFQAASPRLRLLRGLPASPLLVDHRGRGLGEGGQPLDAALVGQRVAARAGELAVGHGLLAGLGERDEGDTAEAEFAAPAADDEALDPAAGAGRLHVKVEAVAVDVVTRRGGADEGGRERLVGMAASALGSTACRGGFCLCIHPRVIYEIVMDSAKPPDRALPPTLVINDYYSVLYVCPCTDTDDSGRVIVRGYL